MRRIDWIDWAIGFLLISLVLFLSCEPCRGETYPADVRVKVELAGGDQGHASGTIIESDARGSWVLTACHNLRGTRKVEIEDIHGNRHGVKIIAWDKDPDLALLWTKYKTDRPRPMAANITPDKSKTYWVTGWPGLGTAYKTEPAVLQSEFFGQVTEVLSAPAVLGQSGGAIVDENGLLVGVVSGVTMDDTQAVAPMGQIVRSFVEKAILKSYYETQCRNGACRLRPIQGPIVLQPNAPRVVPKPTPSCTPGDCPQRIPLAKQKRTPAPENRPNPTPPACDCKKKIADLNRRLATLESAPALVANLDLDEVVAKVSQQIQKTQPAQDAVDYKTLAKEILAESEFLVDAIPTKER